MKELPIQLERYFFPHQEVIANHEFIQDKDGTHTHTDINSNLSPVPEQKGKYGIDVQLVLNQEKSNNPPYFFKIIVFGVFTLNETEIDPENFERLIRETGSSILIGAARERLAEITSRGPWPAQQLGIVPLTQKTEQDEE